MNDHKHILSKLLVFVLVLTFIAISSMALTDPTSNCPICPSFPLVYQYILGYRDYHAEFYQCTNPDYKTAHPSADGVISQFIIFSGPHVPVEIYYAPTCTAEGLAGGVVCAVCDSGIAPLHTVPMLPHTEAIDPAVPAACTATGLTQGKHCSVCDTVLIARQVTQMLPHTEVIDPAVPAACAATGLTQGKHCSVCDTVLIAQQTLPARGHDYAALVTRHTCAKQGFTTFTCRVCGDTYTGDFTKRLAHWYGAWTSNDDGTHSALCRRDGCGCVKDSGCAYDESKLGEQRLRVCPVCGDAEGLPFEAVSGTAANAGSGALPRGELVLLQSANPFGLEHLTIPGLPGTQARVLYAFTVAFEFAGQPEALSGKVRVSLPMEGLTDFMLGRLDENGGWVEIPWTNENGTLSFETDRAGLFLIIAKV